MTADRKMARKRPQEAEERATAEVADLDDE
jgi:hypothetical protein